MALPNVEIIQLNDQLGTIPPNEDGVAGLIVLNSTNVPEELIDPEDPNGGTVDVVNQALLFRSLADATDVGIQETSYAYRHIADFYRISPRNAKLYVSFSTETTVKDALEKDTAAQAFLDQAGGDVKLLGIVNEAKAALPFADAIAAGTALRKNQADQFRYVSILLEGKVDATAISDLPDLRGNDANRVSVVVGAEPEFIGDTGATKDGYAAVGLVLGRLAGIPVQRNIGRVKDGPILTVNAGFPNGDAVSAYRSGAFETLNDKGYITFRKYAGIDGFYFNDDHTATLTTDDYAGISAGRTIDKASRIAYRIYINELLDDIDLNDDGTMRPSVIAYFQSVLQNAIAGEMADEISNVIVFADPTQKVASTSQIKISMSVTRRGQAKKIVVTIGFTVPGA